MKKLEAKQNTGKNLRKRRTKGRRKKNGERIMFSLQFHGPLSLMNERSHAHARAPAEKREREGRIGPVARGREARNSPGKNCSRGFPPVCCFSSPVHLACGSAITRAAAAQPPRSSSGPLPATRTQRTRFAPPPSLPFPFCSAKFNTEP